MIGMHPDHVVFWNDGLGIPVQRHEESDMYVPELIFGNLLTSTNYDDSEDRLTSGRNGVGVKLSNVFSKRFEVEVYDADSKKVYTQVWKDHMRDVGASFIRSKSSPKTSYTKITFWPDFECFGGGWGDVLPKIFHRIAHDTSALVGVPVHWEEPGEEVEKIVYKSLRAYVQQQFPVHTAEILDARVDLGKNQYADIVIAMTDTPECIEVGYVNGIYNREGGVHVDAVTNEFFRQLYQKCAKSKKEFPLSIKDIRAHFLIMVHAVLINPSFTNQNKTKLVAPAPKIVLDPKLAQTVYTKWDTLKERVAELLRQKEILSLKKSENKKRQGSTVRIDGLDAANLAGTNRSEECTLILCEGLSAKTYAVAGIQIGWDGRKGRDYFGIYPLRGKLLNCRNASVAVISQNKEMTDLIQALNLRHNVDYGNPENRKQLHYGRVLILTDSDVDGLHISSLIINAFHCLFPTLCRPTDPFIYWMMTPVAKIYPSRGETMTFFNDYEYQRALEALGGAPRKVKYFKGLGTSSNDEVCETFAQKIVAFEWDEHAGDALVRAFSSTMANERKRWMEKYDRTSYDIPGETYRVTDFLDQELIRYSIDDCQRSLPGLFDGLKQSHRKILYAVFKRNLTGKSMKVAQLAGYVAEVSNYHHGEQCLYDTVTKMAHQFVGSNNIPYLYRDGQFGSRTYLGKDAANARYIFTRLDELTRLIYPQVDDALLHHTMDDGDIVEPDYYVPILPMILVNGCVAGIGTGWSCSVPCFHPLRLVEAIRIWLSGDASYPEDTWTPWYRGFRGAIVPHKAKTFMTEGILEEPGTWEDDGISVSSKKKRVKKASSYRITEIPVKESINRYKEFLERLQEEKKIRNLCNYSTADDPYFVFEKGDASFTPTMDSMKLRGEVSVSNIVLFLENQNLQKFDSVRDVFEAFCTKRLDLYGERKTALLTQWERQLRVAENRLRFLKEVADDTLRVFRVEQDEIIRQLETRKYDRVDDSYEYLLSIRIRQFANDQWTGLEKEIARYRHDMEKLRATTPSQLWLADLEEFTKAYEKVYPVA